MSFFISELILHNRAPFEHLELSFSEKDIVLLNASNGGGKTTVLSHIADAWHEMARHGYIREFEGKAGKYYRISSSAHGFNDLLPSLFYIRFIKDGEYFDYLDLCGKCTLEQYDSIVKLDDKITYKTFQRDLEKAIAVKKLLTLEEGKIQNIFDENVITYFPAYRYEEPGYLNDPFSVKTSFNLKSHFSGNLKNPIEVITGLPELANWMMDVVLDYSMYKDQAGVPSMLFDNINKIFSNTLSGKFLDKVSIGIGMRNGGALRIQVGKRDEKGEWAQTVYPSIFNMSSGENAVITLFGEILRQFDRIKPAGSFREATGIVLIDEVDKHLHVKLQKEILPKMFGLFPNIQFLISSHAPFASMGLVEDASTKLRTKIIDLDKNGIEVEPISTDIFREAYEVMISENERFRKLYNELKGKEYSEKLVIVSEGHNVKHIERAVTVLGSELLDKIEFSFSDKTGHQQLKNAYDAVSASKQGKYLFVFDCDVPDSYRQLQENDNFFVFVFEKRTEDCRAMKGIENVYPAGVITDNMYSLKEEVDGDGGKKAFKSLIRMH